MDGGAKLMADTNSANGLCFEDTKYRIRKMFGRIELSVSSYDTAWVAMVPSPISPHNPCFPACLNWLLDNQLPDGSWGACPFPHPMLAKDTLSSTLAGILALRRWRVGEEQMTKGLRFIESHFGSVYDENQLTPIGFDIIFSGMVEYAKELNLNLPLRSTDMDALFHKRDLELRRCWLQGEEEIFLDPVTCAMAFEILCTWFNVFSEPLTAFDEESFFSSLGGYLKTWMLSSSYLRLHRWSYIQMNNSWRNRSGTSRFLKRELSNSSTYAYKNKQNIIQKLFEYRKQRFPKTCSGELQCLSFNIQEELNNERWVREMRLDKLKFARQKLAYCYFSAAATMCSPELSDARISWAKNGVLTTVVDDFFDVGGSEDELLNLPLVEKHDSDTTSMCSEEVEIIFSALHSTISDIGEKAIAWQGRNVKTHVTEIWLDLLQSMWQEAQWLKQMVTPTNFEDVVKSHEYNLLYKHVSTCGRLLNDIHSFKRESMEGKRMQFFTHNSRDQFRNQR
ncbi:Detected protein of unknown function [Hibiscus syriacus]|uniref:Terpene synthase metal-binding domain-containing protein n=1 Tax=Hibiscus syriacus TaxID=106335 RepID=A0A6A3CW84_HIBSY|nr:Detected protein of unknown function [Hibiscus syriacus]